MNAFNRPKRDEGVALILSLIFLIAMAILVAAMADRTGSQTNQVVAYIDFEDTFEGMESAFAMARAELNGQAGAGTGDRDGLVGVDASYDLAGPMPTFGMSAVVPLEIDSMAGIEYYAVSYDWTADGIDNNGDGAVDDVGEADYYSIYAFARGMVSSRRGEMVLNGGNVNIWSNAIFAGGGQVGNLINGNVSIHGSVHLLGGNLNEGDPAISAIDLSGTSLIHNNYVGMPADLRDRIPDPPTTIHDGQTIDTLKAKLRVKQGMVGLSGTSEIGEAQDSTNTWKETMDSIYVNDGYSGTSLDGDGNPTNVFSDNGWSETYDLGNAVPFPNFTDDGGQDHLAYYLETDADPNVGLQQVHVGDIDITTNQNYFWNATTGEEAVGVAIGDPGMPNLADLDPNHFYMWFDKDTNQMVTNGRIPVDGNITFDWGAGNDKVINYSGKGTMMAYDANSSGDGGDVGIEVSLISQNLDGTTANSFPENNLFGIQAEDDMMIGQSAQLELMGGFYAQDTISVNRQTTIIGTIVGDYMDMGTNVPDIYQVPALQEQWLMQMRMIGSNTVRFVSPISWREIGVL